MTQKIQSKNILFDEDSFETPSWIYEELKEKYQIHPQLDVAATGENSLCFEFLHDAIHQEWIVSYLKDVDVWCNPPHSKIEQFVKKADEQWGKYGMNIMMLIPANAVCAHYFDKIFLQERATYYRISGRIRFGEEGYASRFPSRNSYFVVIWRKNP